MLSCLQAQLGLAHAYSRAKVKFNVNRVDNMIIQAIALLDTLDKDINTFVMRVREWYSWHFPELVKIVNDNYQYSKLALLIKDKGSLTEDKVRHLLCTVAALMLLLSCYTPAVHVISRSLFKCNLYYCSRHMRSHTMIFVMTVTNVLQYVC